MTTNRTCTELPDFDTVLAAVEDASESRRSRWRDIALQAEISHSAYAIGVHYLQEDQPESAVAWLRTAVSHGLDDVLPLLRCSEAMADGNLRVVGEWDTDSQGPRDASADRRRGRKNRSRRRRAGSVGRVGHYQGGLALADPAAQNTGDSRKSGGLTTGSIDALDQPVTLPQAFPRGTQQLTKETLDPVVRSAAAGNRGAVERLIEMITPVAVRYCRARLGGRDLGYLAADDIAQEVCLAVLHALPRYQEDGRSFLYLVHAIASSKVADAYQIIARDRAEPVAELPDHPGTVGEPEQRALDVDLGERMTRLLAALPSLQREILTLRIAVGLSANETAEALGISAGNVRVTQHRALAALRKMVTRDGDLRE